MAHFTEFRLMAGSSKKGSAFKIHPDGTGYTTLYNFGGVIDDGKIHGPTF